jgi:hypothetical protein
MQLLKSERPRDGIGGVEWMQSSLLLALGRLAGVNELAGQVIFKACALLYVGRLV